MGDQAVQKQIDFLQRIKQLIYPTLTQNSTKASTVTVEELTHRIEKIENLLEQNNPPEEGIRKNKVKERIIDLLKENKKLSSSQLSKLLGLSRTRCNEYFRELTKEGMTEGVIINRQKYYKSVRE